MRDSSPPSAESLAVMITLLGVGHFSSSQEVHQGPCFLCLLKQPQPQLGAAGPTPCDPRPGRSWSRRVAGSSREKGRLQSGPSACISRRAGSALGTEAYLGCLNGLNFIHKLLRAKEMVGNVKKEDRAAYMSQSPGLLPQTRAVLWCNYRGHEAHYTLSEGCALKVCNTAGSRGKLCCN